MKKGIKIWNLIEGPTHIDELIDEEFPDGAKYRLVCSVEENGKLEDANFWFETEEDANDWIKHFRVKIDPIEIKDVERYRN